METYFYMDHARKAWVTPSPNLATESQKYAKSRDFSEKRVSFGMLFCEETLRVGGFFCQDFDKRAWERLVTYLANIQ